MCLVYANAEPTGNRNNSDLTAFQWNFPVESALSHPPPSVHHHPKEDCSLYFRCDIYYKSFIEKLLYQVEMWSYMLWGSLSPINAPITPPTLRLKYLVITWLSSVDFHVIIVQEEDISQVIPANLIDIISSILILYLHTLMSTQCTKLSINFWIHLCESEL